VNITDRLTGAALDALDRRRSRLEAKATDDRDDAVDAALEALDEALAAAGVRGAGDDRGAVVEAVITQYVDDAFAASIDVTQHGYYVQYVMQDGGSLCGRCVKEETSPITFNSKSDSPDDAQWNVIGRQLVDDSPFDCANCGCTYTAE
jgi:hypothetical protein